jgi:uncharacterized protein (TIGR02246 family)
MARLTVAAALVACVVLVAAQLGATGADVKAAIQDSLQKYANAVSEKDLEGAMEMFADEVEPVMMGTGPGELWVGKGEIADAHKHFFEGFAREKNETTWRQANVKGDVAWGGATYTVTQHIGDKENTFHLNLTMVMVKEGGVWRIAMVHFSNLTGPDRPPEE